MTSRGIVTLLILFVGIMPSNGHTRALFNPFDFIHQEQENKIDLDQTPQVKKYLLFYQRARELREQCMRSQDKTQYSNLGELDNALRSVVSNLQYWMLMNSIQSISLYTKKLGLDGQDRQKLIYNLTQNYCSENLTLFSKKRILRLFDQYYERPNNTIMPDFAKSYQVSSHLLGLQKQKELFQRYLMLSMENFIAACSWNGDTDNYRLLSPYLEDAAIMAELAHFLEKQRQSPERDSLLVSCQGLICRQSNKRAFEINMPRVIGSPDIATDIKLLYCGHFSKIHQHTKESDPRIKQLIDEKTLDDKMHERFFFHSTIHGFAPLYLLAEKYQDFTHNWNEHIKYFWEPWLEQALNIKSFDLLFEESIKVQYMDQSPENKRDFTGLEPLSFSVDLGEFDTFIDTQDKLHISLLLRFHANFFRWALKEWSILKDLDSEDRKRKVFEKHFNHKIQKSLNMAQQNIKIPIISPKLAPMVSYFLLQRVATIHRYAPEFSKGQYQDEIVIPLNFHFGPFALKAIREKFIFEYQR